MASWNEGDTMRARIIAAATAILIGVAVMAPATAAPATAAPATEQVGGSLNTITINVTGAAVTNISSTVTLDPVFTPSDTDYVWYCHSGTTDLTIDVWQGSLLTAYPEAVLNNQAVIVNTPGTTYWIRCLPANFPHLTVSGAAAPGYYVTGTFGNGASPGFPMILNQYGTPVWYLTGVPDSAQDVEILPYTHTVEWASDRLGYFNFYNLDTQTATTFIPPIGPFDGHEYYTDTGGNTWMFAVPIKSGYNLTSLGQPKVHSIVDCVVQELSPSGQLLWSWDASQFVSPLETDGLDQVSHKQGVPALDVYHCNSIDIDPLNPDNVLVSMRNVGVLLIDKATGDIEWKLPSLNVTASPMNDEPVLTVEGDPEGGIMGQHDARFQPNGDISLFDDHTKAGGAARGVEYTIDTTNDTATLDWEYAAPSGRSAASMGSVRRYDDDLNTYDQDPTTYGGPQETIVDWGHGAPTGGFTVLGPTNNVLMNVVFPKKKVGNRAVEVPLTALPLQELRDSAGLPLG